MEHAQLSDSDGNHGAVSPPEEGYETVVQETPDHFLKLDLLVSGVHCGGCIQKIESTLLDEKDVQTARLNFSTRRLSLIWDGPAARANDLVAKVKALGYGVQAFDPALEKLQSRDEEKFLLLCLGVAGFAVGNIMLLSVGLWITNTEEMGISTRAFLNWFSALIAIPTILFSGRPFFRSAYAALSNRHTNMDVPISLAVLLAAGMSVHELLTQGEHVYFDSAVMLLFFLLIGRYLDTRARRSARSNATDLLSTLTGFATIVEDGQTRKLPISALRPSMVVRVSAGEKFPADGTIKEGRTDVDTALVTGETLPQTLKEGSEVFAGTLNLSAPVLVEVVKAAQDSLLADIVRLMEKAGQGQARYVRLADKAAKLYTPAVHTLALLAFLLWWGVFGAPWQSALLISVTVLIITCPCALGLAVPVVQVLATGRLMKKSILVKSGDALERLAAIDTIVLDKTGTLTVGKPALRGVYDPDLLKRAASLAAQSSHPLSKALHSAYDGEILPVQQVTEYPGQGIEGMIGGKQVRLGSRSWCGEEQAEASASIELWLDIEGQKPSCFYFADTLKEDAAQTLRALEERGLEIHLLSGDRQEVVDEIAAQSAIKIAQGDQKPDQKFAYIENLKKQGRHILMVGDGLNDAPALAGADISMAPGTAIDMAQNAADIVFMGDDFSPVLEAYDVACRTNKLVKQNFILAVAYNMVAVPLAFAGYVTPMIAALAMSGSSLGVIANSFRLNRG